jgi:ribonuclease H / adenosylcobalamin/alpha-ribazole phosphatase
LRKRLFFGNLSIGDDLSSTRFILIRHGESEGNRERRFTTSHLTPLTQVGRQQARAAAEWLAKRCKPDLVVVSPYVRTRQTGEIIAGHLGLDVEVEDDLRERHMGILAGQPYRIVAVDPTFDRARYWLWRPAGGEDFRDVRARAGRVLDRLAETHRGRELVVVSHGGVMAALWAHASGNWGEASVPRNCGIIITEHAEGRYKPPFTPE